MAIRNPLGSTVFRSIGRRLSIGFLVGSTALAASHSACAGRIVELVSRPPAPDFVLEDIGGNDHRLSDMKGDVVLVNFWASWCAPCRAEMPSLQRLQNRIGEDRFRILAVNIGEGKEDISQFYFSLDPPLTFTILMDRDMSASQFWPMQGLPVTFLVDRSGRVTHVSSGARRWDTNEVVDLIAHLKGEAEHAESDGSSGGASLANGDS